MCEGDARERLEHALAMWRQTGEAAHAAALDAAARSALTEWTPPITGDARAFNDAWFGAVEDIVGRSWALETLFEQLPGDGPYQRARALAIRMRVLALYRPDPRFVRASQIREPADVTFDMGLERACRGLESAAQRPPIAEGPPPLPPATPEIEALWRAVTPDDDSALAVLADALQLVGDPRGELIVLQLLHEADDDPARAARCKELIARHGDAWLGDLREFTAAASFERGALRRLELSSQLAYRNPRWGAVSQSPGLATVTALLPGHLAADEYARFVTSPAMRSLRSIDLSRLVTPHGLRGRVPASITHLACPGLSVAQVTAVLPRASQLRSIAIASAEIDALLGAPWFHQLDTVTIAGISSVRRGFVRWDEMPGLETLVFAPTAHLAPCADGHPWDFSVTLRREGNATIARIGGDWLQLSADVLSALPEGTARLEVEHPSATQVERIQRAIPRSPFEIVHRPVPRCAAVLHVRDESHNGGRRR